VHAREAAWAGKQTCPVLSPTLRAVGRTLSQVVERVGVGCIRRTLGAQQLLPPVPLWPCSAPRA